MVKTTFRKSSVSGGANSRKKYFSVSERQKLCISSDRSFVTAFRSRPPHRLSGNEAAGAHRSDRAADRGKRLYHGRWTPCT